VTQHVETGDAWRHQTEFARHCAFVPFEAIVLGPASESPTN
jgi:hypothetical protein